MFVFVCVFVPFVLATVPPIIVCLVRSKPSAYWKTHAILSWRAVLRFSPSLGIDRLVLFLDPLDEGAENVVEEVRAEVAEAGERAVPESTADAATAAAHPVDDATATTGEGYRWFFRQCLVSRSVRSC